MVTPPVRPARQPAQRPGQRPAQQTGQRPAQQTGQRSGQRPPQHPGQRPPQQPGQRPGQGSGQRPPQFPPRRPAKPAGPVLQQRAGAALMLALISLIGLILLQGNLRRAVVVLIVTLVIGATGLWLAITSMSRARKEGTARPRFAVLATVFGVAATGMSALFLAAFALFWPQVTQYVNCLSGANTVASRAACNQQLSHSLQGSMGIPAQSAPGR